MSEYYIFDDAMGMTPIVFIRRPQFTSDLMGTGWDLPLTFLFWKDIWPGIFIIWSCHLRDGTILRAAHKVSITRLKLKVMSYRLLPSHDGEKEHDHFAWLTIIPDNIQNSISIFWRAPGSVLDSCTDICNIISLYDKYRRLVSGISASEWKFRANLLWTGERKFVDNMEILWDLCWWPSLRISGSAWRVLEVMDELSRLQTVECTSLTLAIGSGGCVWPSGIWLALVSSLSDDGSSMGRIGRDTRQVYEEPTSVIDGGSGLLNGSRRILCRVLSDTKDSEELSSLCWYVSDEVTLSTYLFPGGSIICESSSIGKFESCDIVAIKLLLRRFSALLDTLPVCLLGSSLPERSLDEAKNRHLQQRQNNR